jgi:hypothetical protein
MSWPHYECRLTDDGFKLLRKHRLLNSVRWTDVRGVAAYQQDTFIAEDTVVVFHLAGHSDYLYVSEETENFKLLLAAMQRHLPGLDPAWETNVPWAHECAPEWTVIWGNIPRVPYCHRCNYDLRGHTDPRCPECGHDNSPTVCQACLGTGRFQWSARAWWWAALPFALAGLTWISGHWLRVRTASITVILALIGLCVVLGVWLNTQPSACPVCHGTGRPPDRSR